METLAEWIVYFYYIVAGILLGLAIWNIYKLYKGRPTKGQTRVMGAPFAIFVWIQFVFYLAMAESVFSIVSFLADFPFWVDIVVFLSIILFVSFLYFRLAKRHTFKPKLFLALILIPLGFPSASIVFKLVKTGSLELSQKGIYIAKHADESLNHADESLEYSTRKLWPKQKLTIMGIMTFKNTHEIGSFGDYMTARRMTAMGYEKLISKNDKIHGIDGVYMKKTGENYEIRIVENKVDKSELSERQMTDQWIQENAEKLANSNDSDLRNTGNLILELYNKKVNFSRELWKYNLEKGSLEIHLLDDNAKIIGSIPTPQGTETFIKNSIRDVCNTKRYECSLQ